MKLIEYKGGGKSFFIPEFTSDAKPVEQEEFENHFEDEDKAAAWFEHQHELQMLDHERRH